VNSAIDAADILALDATMLLPASRHSAWLFRAFQQNWVLPPAVRNAALRERGNLFATANDRSWL
jgi:hypothetical protein